MSISLPNGTLLAAPSTSTQQYTAAVTRILHLSNFPAELKTRDIQAMFREYENEKGGFRIKWLDDVNVLVVFADAQATKRAYLAFLLHPPSNFPGHIRPYDGDNAAQIIQSLAARSMGHRGSTSIMNGSTSFISGLPESSHSRNHSSSFGAFSLGKRSSLSTGSGSAIRHNRTGSTGASFSRPPISGVLNFNIPSTQANRLPTHDESSVDPSRSASSSDNEPVITMDPPGLGSSMNGGWRMGMTGGSVSGAVRRDSMSAEKAMKEVEKALASVEIKS